MSSPYVVEACRRCRDEDDRFVAAEFILWGKLFPPEHLGPRCYEHAKDAIGWHGMSRIDQWAVFDLRGLRRDLSG